MGKGIFNLQAEKVILKYQHAQNFKPTTLFYKLSGLAW